jgi:hypothetical protein
MSVRIPMRVWREDGAGVVLHIASTYWEGRRWLLAGRWRRGRSADTTAVMKAVHSAAQGRLIGADEHDVE